MRTSSHEELQFCAGSVGRKLRCAIKSAVIVAFFVFAAFHSWIRGDTEWSNSTVAVAARKGFLSSIDVSTQLLRKNAVLGEVLQRSLFEEEEAGDRVLLEEEEKEENATDDSSKQCAGIDKQPKELQCQSARMYCVDGSGRSVINYLILHYCGMEGQAWVSVPFLVGAVILAFYFLAETAEQYFSPVVRQLVEILRMSPSMGGVTLLALGNGAPDIFASLAAIGGDNSRIGLGAILSAGTFVSAFVVGSVAMAAAPFSVRPMPFVRDALFYVAAVSILFVIYLRGEIVFWQAVGLMAFYAIFVVVVICTEQVKGWDSGNAKVSEPEASETKMPGNIDPTSLSTVDSKENNCKDHSVTGQVIHWLLMPGEVVLKATIPEVDPLKWNRAYGTANVVLCPFFLLYMFSSLVALNQHIIFLAPSLELPLWVLVLVQGFFMGSAYFLAVKRPPESGHLLAVIVAFVMSVFWISFIAGELLGCLMALGRILGVSPALLGLTVLAWGNSIGDLVADVAVARVGQPAMAVTGCFAGPMFNMLVGLGLALTLRTAKDFPVGYKLDRHPGILVAFGFLVLGLLGSLVVVTCSGFQVTRSWGICLISWYLFFMVVSAVVANMTSGLTFR
ncbi:unnamed protein product [Sphagnum jensenii]|uniref:Sodium/calcium exchanger membrane region domain-containing protein n=1 Tax=Sphagnum jensenii TaxID=128206 RepID=A0ABP0WVP2_9BRYO